MIPPEELRHLIEGPRLGEQPGGGGLIEVVVRTRADASDVLRRCQQVLRRVLESQVEEQGDEDLLSADLPDWFVRGDAVAGASPMNEPWQLLDWLAWFEPEERQWYWWDGIVRNHHELVVLIEVVGWPYAVGALECLLRAAGAESIEIKD